MVQKGDQGPEDVKDNPQLSSLCNSKDSRVVLGDKKIMGESQVWRGNYEVGFGNVKNRMLIR